MSEDRDPRVALFQMMLLAARQGDVDDFISRLHQFYVIENPCGSLPNADELELALTALLSETEKAIFSEARDILFPRETWDPTFMGEKLCKKINLEKSRHEHE